MIKPTKRHQYVWCLYDWAHTVWPALIITFVFPNYFVQHVANTPLEGNIQWAQIMTISGILIAALAPILGVLSDTMDNSGYWFTLTTMITIICAYSLWFVMPSSEYIGLCYITIITGTLCFELSSAFYNGYLLNISTPKTLSKISGIAWGLGYIAGIACLGLCLVTLVIPEQPLFISTKDLAHIRIVGPIVGTWFLLFGTPLMAITYAPTKHSKHSFIHIVQRTYAQCLNTIHKTKKTPYIYYYLICRMIYTDGVNTLFMFAGIYAAATFDMGFEHIMYFGIACNLSAGIGCFFASWLDTTIGEKNTLLISLALLTILSSCILLTHSYLYFWVFSLLATIFVGPIQTSSRSLMAKICPPHAVGEFFGLYALSGRITAFLGPMLLGFVTAQTNSQALGMSTILLFFIIGFIGLYLCPIPKDLILPQTTKD